MLVYNTGGSLSTGVYYWDGIWKRVDGATLGGDTIVGNEVTNATLDRALVRAGSGTAADPFTLGISYHAVDTSMLAPFGTGALYSWHGSMHRLHYVTFYTKIVWTAADSLRWDSIMTPLPGGCASMPYIYLSYSSLTERPSWFFKGGTSNPWIVGSWSPTPGSWYLSASCWTLD